MSHNMMVTCAAEQEKDRINETFFGFILRFFHVRCISSLGFGLLLETHFLNRKASCLQISTQICQILRGAVSSAVNENGGSLWFVFSEEAGQIFFIQKWLYIAARVMRVISMKINKFFISFPPDWAGRENQAVGQVVRLVTVEYDGKMHCFLLSILMNLTALLSCVSDNPRPCVCRG